MIYRILLLFVLIGSMAHAQSDPIVVTQDMDIRVLQPKIDQQLPHTVVPKLERKVINIFTINGITKQKESTFEVYPYLSLVDFTELEGVVKETTVQLELNLLVKNTFSGQVFLVFGHQLSGSGKTQTAAVNRAINNIRPQRKVYTDFIRKLRDKTLNYYKNECSNIAAEAEQAVQRNQYQKAIALLYSIPKDSDCRKSNQDFLDQTYNAYQAQKCQSLIQKAEVAMLKKNYKDAINILGQVDPVSPCKDDAQKLLASVKEKVDEETAKKMAFLNKVYSDNVDIEKARQESMKSISNTYIEGIKKD